METITLSQLRKGDIVTVKKIIPLVIRNSCASEYRGEQCRVDRHNPTSSVFPLVASPKGSFNVRFPYDAINLSAGVIRDGIKYKLKSIK